MMVYEELLSELNRNKIDYVVIGGVALVLHGVVRLTVDLDLIKQISAREQDMADIEALQKIEVKGYGK